MTGSWPHGDPRDVVRAIVADPRFVVGPAAPPAQRSWLDAVRESVVHFLRGIFHALDRALTGRTPLDTAIGVGLLIAVGACLGYGVYLGVRAYRRAGPRRAGTQRVEPPAPGEQRAAGLRSAALAAARSGRYRAAAALLFAAAVRALDERGRVAYDPARTPDEYRRLVRDPAFDAFAVDAVVAIFAAAEPRDDLFERMNRQYDRLFEPSAR